MTQSSLEVPCIAISQPIGTFYIGKLTASELLQHVSILRRGITEEEQKNVQRKLDPRRQREIADYITDPDATFPTSIIVSVYDDAVTVNDEKNKLKFEFDDTLGEVLDGQHRLEGLRLALERGVAGSDFELPVVFMIDLHPEDKAYIFSIINSKQTKVSTSLIFDLFGLQAARSPSRICHEIAQALNAKEGSPFYRGLKMLGKRNFDSEYLTQGSFAKYLLKLISKTPDEDARLEKAGGKPAPDASLPLRQFYLEREEAIIAKIIDNYFGAIAEVFPNEWSINPKDYLLRKSAGYAALMTVLNRIWGTRIVPRGDASREVFVSIANELKQNIGNTPITSAYFSSSEQGAKELADALLNETNR